MLYDLINPINLTKFESTRIFTHRDTCPICHYGIQGELLLGYDRERTLRIVYRCPRRQCGELFIVKYVATSQTRDGYTYLEAGVTPLSHKTREFAQRIKEISPSFVKIFKRVRLSHAV